jgi:hypothetical protein
MSKTTTYEIHVKSGKSWSVDDFYSSTEDSDTITNKRTALSNFYYDPAIYGPGCSKVRLVKITTITTIETIKEAKLPKSRYANL